MKKNYFMLAAATMMFAACAETDLVNEVNMEEAPKAIGFDAFANKTTRAAIEEADDLKEDGVGFHVWGYKTVSGAEQTVFSGDNVYWAAAEGTTSAHWAYNNTRYWDKEATSYNFYAVAPQLDNVENRYIISAAKKITINDVASGPANTATDYLIDRDGVTVDGEEVSIGDEIQFNFSHIMSKVTVQVKHNTTPGTNVDVVLTDLAMSGWNINNGTFTQDKYVTVIDPQTQEEQKDSQGNPVMVKQEWQLATTTAETTSGDYTFLTSGNTTLDKTNATTIGSYLMVPQTGVYLTFTISYKIGEETFLTHEGTIENQTWATNTHYTYTITVGPADIKFNVSEVNGWTIDTGNGTTIQ